MRHILLLRHGLTDANATGVLQGHQPTPLNAVGHAQARRLAARAAAYEPRIEVLVSSDLPRALQTAEPIATACALEVQRDPAWRERGFGELEGQGAAEREIWKAAAGESDPPGAEPAAAFAARVGAALSALPGRFPEARCIAVVTHGGPCRRVLRMLAEGDLPRATGAAPPPVDQVPNCAVLHLVEEDGRWWIARLNDTAHLEGLETEADAG